MVRGDCKCKVGKCESEDVYDWVCECSQAVAVAVCQTGSERPCAGSRPPAPHRPRTRESSTLTDTSLHPHSSSLILTQPHSSTLIHTPQNSFKLILLPYPQSQTPNYIQIHSHSQIFHCIHNYTHSYKLILARAHSHMLTISTIIHTHQCLY